MTDLSTPIVQTLDGLEDLFILKQIDWTEVGARRSNLDYLVANIGDEDAAKVIVVVTNREKVQATMWDSLYAELVEHVVHFVHKERSVDSPKVLQIFRCIGLAV